MQNSATTFKYGRGTHNQHQRPPSSTNGAVKKSFVIEGGEGGGGGTKEKNSIPDREKYHLLNLSDSERNDSAEDLKLPSPSVTGGTGTVTQKTLYKTSAGAITNGVTTAAGRIRRKIRLKRY